MKCKIVKKKLPKATIKKYGFSPVYYEVRREGSMVAYGRSKKEAVKWKRRCEK